MENLKVNIDPEKEKLDLLRDAEKLKPLTRLSKVFTVRPEDEHLHIFVQHIVAQPPPAVGYPSIHLNCLILGARRRPQPHLLSQDFTDRHC